MEIITIGIAEYYSHNLGSEALKGMRERIQEGYLTFSPPYGYKRKVLKDKTNNQKGKIREFSVPAVDKIQAQAVRLIFQSYDDGKGYKAIKDILNSKGFKNNKGNVFSKNTIPYILRNKAYIGTLDWNKKQKGKYRGNTEIITVPNFYPPIVDEELFNCVQEKLDKNAENRNNSYANKTSYLFSSKVVCNKCGGKYVGTSAKGGKFHYYSCQTSLKKGKDACNNKAFNKDNFEVTIIEKIKDRILTADNILRYIQLFNHKYKEEAILANKDIVAIDEAVAKIENNIKRWLQAIEDGKLDAEVLTNRINELNQEKKLLKERKAEFIRKQNKAIDVIIPKNKIEPLLNSIKNRLKNGDFGYKKEFVEEIVDHVAVSSKSVILFYKIPIKKAVKNPFQEFFTASSLAPRVDIPEFNTVGWSYA